MKIIMIKVNRLVIFVICMFVFIYAKAENVTIDGLKYYLFPGTDEAAIDNGNTWSGDLELPSEVVYNGKTYTVSSIGFGAFLDCKELTRVRIPKTIEKVIHHVLSDALEDPGAVSPDCMNPFARCTALETIEVDEDNPVMSSEDGILYSKDKTRLYAYPAGMRQKEYVIPENVTWVGYDAISYNQYLSSLTIPSSVTYCGSICSNCVNLKTVRLSESITYIPAYAFDKCESLKFLDIPRSVQAFGESVFRWTHLEKIVIRGTFPESLRYDTFYSMDDATIIYVQQSEMEKFKEVFSGTVLPLEEYTEQTKGGDANASESIYGEWWLVGWSDKGTWVQVDKKNVGHHSLSIEIPKEDYVMAYSMANEIFVGLLTLNGNEMVFGGEKRGGSTKVYCSFEENLFFEAHICDIKSYQLEKDQLRLYYTNDDYFVFTSDLDNTRETTSGIKSVCEAKTPIANTLYDLQGRRVMGTPRKGLYIQNGKKVIVK